MKRLAKHYSGLTSFSFTWPKAGHLVAVALHLVNDVLHAGALVDEDVDDLAGIHDLGQPPGLRLDVERDLGDADRVDVQLLAVEIQGGHEGPPLLDCLLG